MSADTLERTFTETCDELGCQYDNEAALAAAARLKGIERAAVALLADVRARYPGEELRCPLMRALDAAVSHG